MLKDKYKEIKVSNKNVKHYNEKGYDVNVNDIVLVDIMDIPYNSKMNIDVICDVCGLEKNITVISFRRNIEKYGYYSCSSKCSAEKNKKTNKERYGVTSYTKTDEYLEKTRKTKLEKYGDEKYVNIDKQKETNKEKYGVETFMLTDEFVQKSNKTKLEKYGTIIPLRNKDINKRWKKTNKEKYGDEVLFKCEGIKKKIKETKLEKYGDKNYNNIDLEYPKR